MKHTRSILTVVAGLAAMAVGARGTIMLVVDGQPRAEIVLPRKASADEQAAATELRRCLEKATGAVLPLRTERTPGQPAILIGSELAPAGIRERLRGMARDSFVIDADGDTIVLAGAARDGTSCAVYEFLERFAGVRWLWPGELGEVISRRANLAIENISLAREPAFLWRDLGPGGALWGHHDRWSKERELGISAEHQAAQARWEKRNRFGGLKIHGGHAFGEILPPSVYGPTHPEYYALVSGKRDWENFNGKHRCQPCTSNPEVVAKTAEYCLRMFARQPELDGVSIGLNDGRGFCECENCTRLDSGRMQNEKADPELGRGGPSRIITDRVISFANQVAEAVARTQPAKRLLFYGYSQFHTPPERVKVHPKVLLAYTIKSFEFWSPRARDAALAELAGWARMAPTLGVYEYLTQIAFPDMPRPIAPLLQLELKELQRLGSRYFHSQAGNGFAVNGLNFYVLGKLLWDPAADVRAIQDDYLQHAFGAGQEPMRRYFERLEAAWREKPAASVKMDTFSRGEYAAVLATYPSALRIACRADLAEAHQRAAGDDRKRVEFVREGFRYFELTMAAAEASHPLVLAGWRPGEAASVAKVDAKQVERAIELWRERERFIEEHREDFVLSYLWVKSGDETRSFNPLRRLYAVPARP